ncbi:MAG: hypothetical protein LBV67_11055 [Streptococcaceae bacterium]|jgi:hypothetical protein|nr:hypothetical protein [Streptococcaceae bacterium]
MKQVKHIDFGRNQVSANFLIWSDGLANKLIADSVKGYKKVFDLEFPLFAYLETEKGEVTYASAKKISQMIDRAICELEPVLTPKDYWL